MPKYIRQLDGQKVMDPSLIDNAAFSAASGGQKNTEVGKHLLPLNDGAGGFTTNATTARALPSMGKNIAVYNNSGSLASITFGESIAVVSLAAGATDVDGHVGLPCEPNAWSHFACYLSPFVIASSASLLVFLIDDDTFIRAE